MKNYLEQLEFKEFIYTFYNKFSYSTTYSLMFHISNILNFLNKVYQIPFCSLEIDDSQHRWAVYLPKEKQIILSNTLFNKSLDFIIEIILHEWCHHWQISTKQIIISDYKHKTLDEYDKIVHNEQWEQQLIFLLNLIDIPQMSWVPTYKRDKIYAANNH